jgi:hypothetical protein
MLPFTQHTFHHCRSRILCFLALLANGFELLWLMQAYEVPVELVKRYEMITYHLLLCVKRQLFCINFTPEHYQLTEHNVTPFNPFLSFEVIIA